MLFAVFILRTLPRELVRRCVETKRIRRQSNVKTAKKRYDRQRRHSRAVIMYKRIYVLFNFIFGIFADYCPFRCECELDSVVNCSSSNLYRSPVLNGSYFLVDLSFNQIERLPEASLENCTLRELRIIDNQIPLTLVRKSFKGVRSSLQFLSLKNSLIQNLPAGVFRSLEKLKIIDLSRNILRTLPNGLFKGSSEITHLDLSNNFLTSLRWDKLKGLINLKELRLDSNFIWWLDSKAFFPTRRLVFLSLSHNDLRDLQPSVFMRLKYLKDLDLSNNRLPALFRKNLVGLRSLEQLDLSGNPLVLIVNGALKSLKSMVELHLARTNLRTLQPEMFIGAKNVEWLDLRDSNIEELRPSVFKYLNNLKHLQISGNLITSIDQCIVKNLSKLIDMDLRENPLHCGCSLSWLTQKNMPHLLGECKTPRRRARSAVDYRGNYLGCRKRRNIQCGDEDNRWMNEITLRNRRRRRFRRYHRKI